MLNNEKLKVRTDENGDIIELPAKDINRNIFYVKLQPKGIRGNHYHKLRNEWFYITSGKVEIIIKNINSNQIKRLVIAEDTPPTRIHIPPNHAHTLKNAGDSKASFIAFIETDSSGKDVYPHKLAA